MRLFKFILLSCLMLGGVWLAAPTPALAADNGNILVKTIPTGTVDDKITDSAKGSWPWYVTRASGIVAAITLIILMLSGIGQVTGYTYKILDPLTSWASHRALGIAFGVSVVIHIVVLLFDKFVSFSPLDLLVPWLSNYKPIVVGGVHLGSLYVALGVLAFYLVWIVIITSLLWVEKKPYLWKWMHLLSYIIIIFVFIHALYIGTDLAHGIVRWLWILLGFSILVASVHRMWRIRNT